MPHATRNSNQSAEKSSRLSYPGTTMLTDITRFSCTTCPAAAQCKQMRFCWVWMTMTANYHNWTYQETTKIIYCNIRGQGGKCKGLGKWERSAVCWRWQQGAREVNQLLIVEQRKKMNAENDTVSRWLCTGFTNGGSIPRFKCLALCQGLNIYDALGFNGCGV